MRGKTLQNIKRCAEVLTLLLRISDVPSLNPATQNDRLTSTVVIHLSSLEKEKNRRTTLRNTIFRFHVPTPRKFTDSPIPKLLKFVPLHLHLTRRHLTHYYLCVYTTP